MPRPPLAFSGAVLTGGASRRMGTDKAFVPIGGRPLVLSIVEALEGAGATEVVAVGGDAPGLRALGLQVLPDRHPGSGPLDGLITALDHACEPCAVVVACDLPTLRPGHLGRLLQELAASSADAAVAVVDGRLHPVVGAYRRAARTPLEAAFAGGERALHRALGEVAALLEVELPHEAVADVDSPHDLHRYHHGSPDAGPSRR